MPDLLPLADDRSALRADCSRCAGLCCVAPAFAASADFAVDKPAATPCLHLAEDFRCGVHAVLRERGFPGCTVFDCFGAGQQITQQTFGGHSWRETPELARAQFAVLPLMRQLHEMLWYLAEALTLPGAAPLHAELRSRQADIRQATGRPSDELVGLDVGAHRGPVGELLGRVSDLVRGSGRGAYLIGADLRGADLRTADLLGADLRATDVRGADLSRCLFLTQPQVTAARGDRATLLPTILDRPHAWA